MLSKITSHTVVVVTLASLMAGCVATGESVSGESVDEAAEALSTFAAPFRNLSTMRGSAVDWDDKRGKATCAPGEAISGISQLPGDHQGRTALCESMGTAVFPGSVAATLSTDAQSDQRRATRNGDWAEGYWKLECGAGEYVSGVSENAAQFQGDNGFHKVQCSTGAPELASTTCTTRVFDNGTDQGTTQSGDWDFGAYKGECASDEYVAGVSVAPTSRSPHSLLCCHVEQMIPGKTFWGKSALSEFAATTEAECSTPCLDDATCTGGTFNPDKKQCWLRKGAGDVQPGLVSDRAFTVKPTNDRLARAFAPRVRFDSAATTFPMSAQDFFAEVASKTPQPSGVHENGSYASIQRNEIPTYYQVVSCGAQVRIQYWWFYGYQHDCDGVTGEHQGDWENVLVTLSEDKSTIAAMTFWAHGDPYTRLPGSFSVEDATHPVVFAGKHNHGSYYNQGGSGSCLYWEDFHNNGNDGPRMDTWHKLVSLSGDAEAWMSRDRLQNFSWGPNGVNTHPTMQAPTCSQPASKAGISSEAHWHTQCKNGDGDTGSECLQQCRSGYTNGGLLCTNWSITSLHTYARTRYGYDYALPTTDRGLLYGDY